MFTAAIVWSCGYQIIANSDIYYRDLAPPQPIFSSTKEATKIVIEHASPSAASNMSASNLPNGSQDMDDMDMATLKPMSAAQAINLSPKKKTNEE